MRRAIALAADRAKSARSQPARRRRHPRPGRPGRRRGLLIAARGTRTPRSPPSRGVADGSARGATAVVTLEPCDHTGRTGPCSVALIDAGVRRVVFAQDDLTPRAAGRRGPAAGGGRRGRGGRARRRGSCASTASGHSRRATGGRSSPGSSRRPSTAARQRLTAPRAGSAGPSRVVDTHRAARTMRRRARGHRHGARRRSAAHRPRRERRAARLARSSRCGP